MIRLIGAMLILLAISGITALSAVRTGHAYDLETSPWRDQRAMMDLRVDASDLRDTNQLPRSEWLAALTGAVQVWNEAAQVEHLPVHLRVTSDDPDAEIYIRLTDDNWFWPRRPTNDDDPITLPIVPCPELNWWNDCAVGQTLRYTCDLWHCEPIEGEPVDRAVIVVPVTRPWQVLDGPTPVPSDSIDPETMFMHELGHALGLNHSPKWWLNQDCSSLMVGVDGDPCTAARNDAGAGSFVRRTLARDDICGLRALYGTRCVGAIRGLVIDARGAAVEDATVVVEAASGGTAVVHTDRQGYYQFEDVAIGPAKLAVLKNELSTGATATVEDMIHALLPDIVLASAAANSASITDLTHDWTPAIVGRGPFILGTQDGVLLGFPNTATGDRTGSISALVHSRCALQGDFDLRIDYHLESWPRGVRLGIAVDPGAPTVERVSHPVGQVYSMEFAQGDERGLVRTEDIGGRLRLERRGELARGFYFQSGAWQLISSGAITPDDVHIALSLWTADWFFSRRDSAVTVRGLELADGRVLCSG